MQDSTDPRLKLDDEIVDAAPTGAMVDDGPPPSAFTLPIHRKHLRDYLRIIHKRRWLVGTSFLLVMIAAAVHTYTLIPIYEARAKLLIDEGAPNYVNFQEVANINSAHSDYVQTQHNLLRSRSLAKRTVDTLGLADPATPQPVAATKSFDPLGWLGPAGSWVKGWFVSPPAPAEPPTAATAATTAESRAVDRVLGMLTVIPVQRSRIVDLRVLSADPELAMRVVNAHARAYIEQNLEFKFNTSKEASDWLAERLAEQRQEVEQAESKLQQYREANQTIPAEDSSNIVVQKLGQLNTAVTEAKTKRLEVEAVYEQLKSVQNNPEALDAFPAVLSNPYIQSQRSALAALLQQEEGLAQKFAENHPQLQAVRTNIQTTRAKLQGEINNIVRSIQTQFETARAQEDSLSRALQAQNQEALAMNRTAIAFGVLKREVDSAQQVYQTLLQKAKETGVSSELRTSNVRIVDLAELPRSPSSPNHRSDLTKGLFGGLVIALALGLFFEYLDNRLKTPEEIKEHLGIPPLGLLPSVKGMGAGHPYPLLVDDTWPKLTEAFRTLRTNLIFSSSAQKSRSIVVTSTGPGEGKTLVSANLATSLAQAGLRVVVIDADMRRPALHKALEVAQEPGLSDVLVGEAKASESVSKTAVPGLWILPAGRIPPNPSELLGSKRFRDFLHTLGEHFDWIVIDSPPVMAVADAAVVANVATGVVFVIRSEAVSRYAAQAALEQLKNARASVIGGVLNRVDLDRQAYYYSTYYRKEYSDYYSASNSKSKRSSRK